MHGRRFDPLLLTPEKMGKGKQEERGKSCVDLRTRAEKRKRLTRALVFSAVTAALCVLLLFLGGLLSIADLSFAILATLLIWFLYLEYGGGYALGAYLTASILSLLLLPDKSAPLLFAGFVGWYPLVKLPLERLPRVFSLLCKLLAVNAVCVTLSLLFRGLLGLKAYSLWFLLLLLALYNLAFFLFDISLRKFIVFYLEKLRVYLVKAGLCKG